MLTAGLGGVGRHGCVALSAGGRLLGVCRQERISRVRDAGFTARGLPDDALDALLERQQLTRRSIDRFVAAEPIASVNGPVVEQLDHHLAHAAAAYLSSPFQSAAILICDDDAPAVSMWSGNGNALTRIEWPWNGPGLSQLYSECAALLGLASPGSEGRFESLARLKPDQVCERLSTVIDTDGHSLLMRPSWRSDAAELLGGVKPPPESAGAAASLQRRIADMAVSLVAAIRSRSDSENLCLGGTLFDRSAINSAIAASGRFANVHLPVDTGNGGLAVGTALHADRCPPAKVSPFLGPSYGRDEIKATLDNCKLSYAWESEDGVIDGTIRALRDGLMVGWYEDSMEWGPRALGARCILANPLAPYVLENLNRFLKHRESWRGYALSGLEGAVATHFDGPARAAVMEYDYRPKDPGRLATTLPAPGAAVRLQTVGDDAPPRFRRLLEAFGEATGFPFLVNTSFNGFREPIACSPRDAVRVYYGTGLDVLVADQFVLKK